MHARAGPRSSACIAIVVNVKSVLRRLVLFLCRFPCPCPLNTILQPPRRRPPSSSDNRKHNSKEEEEENVPRRRRRPPLPLHRRRRRRMEPNVRRLCLAKR